MYSVGALPEKPWHSEGKLQNALLAFHQKRASYPEADIAVAQRNLEETLTMLRGELQRSGMAVRLEYTGSIYEGIKVPSTDVEFDVMVVLAGGRHVDVEEIGRYPLYAYLTTSSTDKPLSKMVAPNTECLMPAKAAQYFQGQLQRIIDKCGLSSSIKLKQHGPAVQMDVEEGDLRYSVDMVPAFQIDDDYYVAKPFKDEDEEEDDGARLKAWRRSYSLHEKDKLKRIDGRKGLNQCRKQCIRILKVLRDKEAGLRCMNSYIIKTAIFLLDEDPYMDWSQKKLGCRFIDLLRFLAEKFEAGFLSHFYEQEVNLLTNWTQIHRQNVATRLKELVRSEQSFNTALNRIGGISGPVSGYGQADQLQSDFAQEGAYSVVSEPSFAHSYEEQESDEGSSSGSLFTSLLLGGAALAAAIWVGTSLHNENQKKKNEKK